MWRERRPLSFYMLAGLAGLFVLFLYGPIATIALLSFQGPQGGLTFPLQGVSIHWFIDLFSPQSLGDIWGAFGRSCVLGLLVMVLTVVLSFLAGLAFRTAFYGSSAVPIIYALGTLTTALSLGVIVCCFLVVLTIQHRRTRSSDATAPDRTA